MKRNQRHCSKCSKEVKDSRVLLYFESRKTRWAIGELAKVNPDAAEKIKREMLATEGPEFTEMAIDGMIEKVKATPPEGDET